VSQLRRLLAALFTTSVLSFWSGLALILTSVVSSDMQSEFSQSMAEISQPVGEVLFLYGVSTVPFLIPALILTAPMDGVLENEEPQNNEDAVSERFQRGEGGENS